MSVHGYQFDHAVVLQIKMLTFDMGVGLKVDFAVGAQVVLGSKSRGVMEAGVEDVREHCRVKLGCVRIGV